MVSRHLAILAMTGAGKSNATSIIIDRLLEVNGSILIFDMHGEYKSLTEGEDSIAQSYRIAGPGDLENPSENVLFLPYWLLNREELLSMILDRSDSNAPNQASRFTLWLCR